MAKKLRLAAAGLTDVGRRRERNQDNVTHFVPTDDVALAEKGALFVVCDGMGGHAAGEVAAELGVNTIREVYYSSQVSDIITCLADAIRQANEAIYQYARQHPEMTGMGTTCVALIVQGGRAYFLNIGDSRGYLIRSNQMRQITLDHSWVAEQVRAGLLSEEQARTHAHRNVITRSLGTQPTVSADLFIETLHDGDRVLLCSDGLHGYVEEAEIARAVLGDVEPDVAAQSLIDMANENGGPDNITAVVVHLLDVPEPTEEVKLPEDIVGEEQIITQPIPAMARSTPKRPAAATRQGPAEPSGAPLPIAPAAKRRKPNRAALAVLRLVAVAALSLIAVGIWDFGFGPYAMTRAAVAQAQADIQQAQQAAQQAASQNPAQALAALAQARQRIESDLQNPNLDDQTRQNAQSALDTQIAPAVQSSVRRYNAAALIQPVSMGGVVEYSVSCAAQGQQAPTALASVSALATVAAPATKSGPPPEQLVYALSGGSLYQIQVPLDASGSPTGSSTSALCFAVPLTGVSTVLALAADGTTLFALVQQGTSSFAVWTVTMSGTKADGSPAFAASPRFAVAPSHGEAPTALAESRGAFYVGYKGGTSAGGVWLFTGANPKGPALSLTLTQPPAALTIANGTLYTLLADGSLGQLDSAHTYLPLPVQVQPPLALLKPDDYTSAAPVPTVPASGGATSTATTLFAAGALAADPAQPGNVLVGDGASHRVVRFAGNASGAGLNLSAQYVYTAPLTQGTGLALAASGTALTAYTWDGSQLATFAIPEPAAA